MATTIVVILDQGLSGKDLAVAKAQAKHAIAAVDCGEGELEVVSGEGNVWVTHTGRTDIGAVGNLRSILAKECTAAYAAARS